MKLNAKELRVSEPTKSDLAKIKRRQIYIICDNILDTYNIGSIFRLADAVATSCIYLCGNTAVPPYHRIAKAAVGTDKWVRWKHVASVTDAIAELRGKFSLRSNNKQSMLFSLRSNNNDIYSSSRRREVSSIKIVAIEQSKKAVDYRKADFSEPVAFIVGHETTGVSKIALKLADQIVEIPMLGVNKSLNVMVSLAIVLYKAIE